MLKTIEWNKGTEKKRNAALARPALTQDPALAKKVKAVLGKVKKEGDKALKFYTLKWDKVSVKSLLVSAEEVQEAKALVNDEEAQAIKRAARQIENFHRAQIPKAIKLEVSEGLVCERTHRPIRRVGLYIPGGSAPLPSTVLMLGIPSLIAGCKEAVLFTPPQKNGKVNPHVLFAADLCGIKEIYKTGGAQAIAAMAYGTKTIAKVDKIFGPGNSWVTEAKKQVAADPSGAVCDMPAGPSEVMVIADEEANPEFVAADLLSQAEHGPDSQVVLVTQSMKVIEKTVAAVKRQVALLPRKIIALKSLKNSRAVLVETLLQAMEVSNRYAPEHLILQVKDPRALVPAVENAGSVFLGAWAPESLGDYASGTNHVLPTYGYARAMGGVALESFLKGITFQEATPAALQDIGPTVERLARMEGLTAHEMAVTIRLRALTAEAVQ